MNIQTLKAKLSKGQKDLTKDVVVVANNKEYNVVEIYSLVDKVQLVVEPANEAAPSDSLENQAERTKKDSSLRVKLPLRTRSLKRLPKRK